MFRYVVDDLMYKLLDFFKVDSKKSCSNNSNNHIINNNNINKNIKNRTAINKSSQTTTNKKPIDLNNNYLEINNKIESTDNQNFSNNNNNNILKRNISSLLTESILSSSQFDELDWFKEFRNTENLVGNSAGAEGEQLEEEEEQESNTYDCYLAKENSFDYLDFDKPCIYLNKSLSTSLSSKLSSVISFNNNLSSITNSKDKLIMDGVSLNGHSNHNYPNNENRNEILSFDNDINYDIDLNDIYASNMLKAVKVFQKSYYKEQIKGEKVVVPAWRMREKMKTISAALVMCLNIGVDPPDVVRTSNCSKLECWINQMMMSPQKALETIGAELQKQYERWQPRARYKPCLDPTSEDVKRLCLSLRKNSKDERVLFHYNGHGVPRPTVNGEIWVFNKEFTQYIPLSLYEVQTWMGTPSLYVWDCSNAGLIIQNFLQFEEDREQELIQRTDLNANGQINPPQGNQQIPVPPQLSPNMPRIRDSIHLAACSANELLPMNNPDLPLDLFTACLTTPIKAAINWYFTQNSCQLIPELTMDLLDKIPGQINDRKTMMGELNWIFTAITDTIAWNVLDSDLFQKLFRQDLLVASLFRNFLLAERIMKSLNCNPVSYPALPPTHEHPLWQSWDLALDMCISQLPHIVNTGNNGNVQRDFVSCGFFAQQIEIFDMWLRYNVNSHNPPEQLPVVLQVLLSQQHRLKALELLGKFLDFGPWAVSAALSVGIFPYVLKLLTTQPKELRPLLTFIWAKILAVDKSCQAELVKDNGHVYFILVLADPEVEPIQKVYSAFVLSCLVDNYPIGQESAKHNHLISSCSIIFTDKNSRDYNDPLLRQWCCICLGLCWQNYPEARWEGVRNNAHSHLLELISDPVPEVRAAAIFALGTYIGCGQGNEATIEQTNKVDSEIVNALIKDYDMVYIVRKELIAALYNYINQFLVHSSNNSSNSPTNEQSAASSPFSQPETNGLITNGTNNNNNNSNITKSHSTSSLQSTINNYKLGPNVQTISENPTQNLTQQLGHRMTGLHVSNTTSNLAEAAYGSDSNGSSTPRNGSSYQRTPSQTSTQSNITLTPSTYLTNSNKLFSKVWSVLLDMLNDPYPDVADLAQTVVRYFVSQLNSFDLLKKQCIDIQLKKTKIDSAQLIAASKQQQQPIQISTEFVPWCCKYFLKPLLPVTPEGSSQSSSSSMNGHRNDHASTSVTNQLNRNVDIYTSDYLDQHCKLLYNHMVKRKQPTAWHVPRIMEETLQLKHTRFPIHCKFHPFDDQLFVADKDCLVSVYDTSESKQPIDRLKLSFSLNNQNKPPVITSFKLINVQHEPIILAGTDDRVVRLYKPDLVNYSKNTRLITAFTAFGESLKRESTIKAGLIVEWDEPNEILLCAGDTDYIRVWDMNKELYKDYLTQAKSCVSSLTTGDNFIVAGFGDGPVKLFDFRQPKPVNLSSNIYGSYKASPLQSPQAFRGNYQSRVIHKHDAFVLKVKLHKQSNKLITSSVSGDIRVFDMRNLQGSITSSFNNEPASALECHPTNELIVVANEHQSIKVYDFNGKELTNIKHHEGFLGKRIAHVSCIDWKHNKNEIVFGSNDNYLTIFSCRD